MNSSAPSIRRRLASMAYESMLVAGVLSVAFMIPHLLLGMGFSVVLPGWLLFAHLFIVIGIYFVWQWHNGGQTLAMKTWHLELTTTHGTAPSLNQLYLRYILAWPSVIYLGAGLIWAIFDRDRQFLHDRLARTRLRMKSG